jgi:hypothetical protein
MKSNAQIDLELFWVAMVGGAVSAAVWFSVARWLWPVIGPDIMQPCPLFSGWGLTAVAAWQFVEGGFRALGWSAKRDRARRRGR